VSRFTSTPYNHLSPILAVDPQKTGYSRRVENAIFWP
jgi:hypothetical protein